MQSEPKLGSPANIFWIAITTIAVLAWCFGPQTLDWHQAKKMGESQPCLGFGVQPMAIENIDVAPGTTEVFFGYEFEVPWSYVEAKVNREMLTLMAANGHALMFWDPAATHNLFADTSKPIQHPNMKDALGFVVGKEAARSNYELVKRTLNITPEQITPMLSNREANGRMILLRMKSAVYCGKGRPAFYSYKQGGLNCLQLGGFGAGQVIEVKCFDELDRELDFHFSARQDASTALTQAEINRVVQTLRPVKKTPAASTGTAPQNN